MEFVFVNFVMFFSFYLFTERIKIGSFGERILACGLLWMAQIILTELWLGVASLLYLNLLIGLNLLISLSVLAYSFREVNPSQLLKRDFRSIRRSLPLLFASENKILAGLGLLVMVWFVLAAYFLPPRGGADDIFYHLPPVYEFIIKHKIYLMPLYEIKYTFAFPLNAELLFVWPAIFFHNQRWVDFVQVVIALWGSCTVYVFARSLGRDIRWGFFLALLFFFSPVVLHQAESNYIDLITTVFFLAALYFSWKFFLKGDIYYLYLAGLAGGLLLGMKYFFIIFWLVFQLFIVPRIRNLRAFQIFLYLLIDII